MLTLAATTGPVAPFLVEVGILVAALAVVARLASALRMPAVPLYLLVGVAAGSGGLLPLGFSAEFIAAGAQIGVLLLLFMLGLEFSGDDLAASLRSGRAASALDALNALPGLIVGLALGWSLAASVLLAGATYVSSSGIVAKLLDELDRVGNRETPIVLGVLVSEDLAMAAILPIAAVLVSGEPLLRAALIASGALVVAGFAVLVAIRYGHRISRLLVHSSDEAVLLSVLGLVLIVGGAAEAANISAAIGAFLVGTALSDPVAARARQLIRPLRDVFAATFFVFFGLRIDTGLLMSVMGAAVVLWAVSAALKVATGSWAARRAGIGVRGAARAGTALIARGEFSILLAQLGVNAGLEPQLRSAGGGLRADLCDQRAVTGAQLRRDRRHAARLAPASSPRTEYGSSLTVCCSEPWSMRRGAEAAPVDVEALPSDAACDRASTRPRTASSSAGGQVRTASRAA